ncbi:MAG: hypothetical protein WC802_04855 [Patescibacteria group bacterium]|jgi:hypothetical protein
MHKASSWILRLYFAVISGITLVTLMFGAIDLLSIGLKSSLFKAADVPDYIQDCSTIPVPVSAPATKDYTPPTQAQLQKECDAQKASSMASYQRTKASNAVHDLALVIIGLPLFALHFRFVYKDWLEEKKN